MARATPQKAVSKISGSGAVKFWHNKHFAAWLVFFAAFLLFANSITGGYNLDDELVTINHRLTSKGISAIPEIFTSHYYHDESGYSYEYRPVVLASFAIEHQFFGDNAHVSHLFNVLFYALCCLVLLQVLLKLFNAYSPLLSLAITLLFIVHPAHTEVVCSIKNRDEILGLLFALLTWLVILNAYRSSRSWWLIFVPVTFALALMAKATVISFIIIIPVALIFFTDIKWPRVLLVCFLLIIPSFFLLNLSSAFIKLVLLTGVAGLSMLLYAIFNFEKFKPAALTRLNKLKALLFSEKAPSGSEVNSEEQPFRLAKILSRFALPDKNLFSVSSIAITVALAGIYLLCITQFHSALALIPLAVLLILTWRGSQRISWWATVFMGICLTVNIGIHHITAHEIIISELYSGLVGTYLVVQMLRGKKSLFVPSLFTLILFIILHVLTFGRFHLYYLILLFFINEPYVVYGVLLIHLVSMVLLGRFSQHSNFVFDVVRISIQIITILWIKLNRGVKALPVLLLVSAIALFHFTQLGADQSFQPQQTLYNVEQASNKLNPQIIAAPQDRPLIYAEECIDSSSTTSVKLGTSMHILLLYACKVVVPYPLSFYYGFKFIYPQKIFETIPMLGFLLYLSLFIAALFFIKRERLISFGLIIYLASIAIFSNYIEPIPGMFADRFLLIPSLGWAVILAVIIQKAFNVDVTSNTILLKQVPKLAVYSLLSVLLLYAGVTFSRNMDWHDDLTLMRHDINIVPQSVQAQNLLGIHLLTSSFAVSDPGQQTAMRNEAVEHIKKANQLFPGFFNYNYDLGRAYMLLNMPDSALTYFKQAAALDTSYHDVISRMASIYVSQNNYQLAIPCFIKLMHKTPNDYSLYAQLSYAYFNTNQFDRSIQTNKEAIRLFPGQVQPYVNIARVYVSTNSNDSARVWLNKALVLSPDNPDITKILRQLK